MSATRSTLTTDAAHKQLQDALKAHSLTLLANYKRAHSFLTRNSNKARFKRRDEGRMRQILQCDPRFLTLYHNYAHLRAIDHPEWNPLPLFPENEQNEGTEKQESKAQDCVQESIEFSAIERMPGPLSSSDHSVNSYPQEHYALVSDHTRQGNTHGNGDDDSDVEDPDEDPEIAKIHQLVKALLPKNPRNEWLQLLIFCRELMFPEEDFFVKVLRWFEEYFDAYPKLLPLHNELAELEFDQGNVIPMFTYLDMEDVDDPREVYRQVILPRKNNKGTQKSVENERLWKFSLPIRSFKGQTTA